MPSGDSKSHTCVVCASRLLLSFSTCPRKGSYHEIGEYGQKVFLFSLGHDEAVAQAERGCDFMEWLVEIPTLGRHLRAAFSNVGAMQVYFEWVDDVGGTVLGGESLTLCAVEGDAAASDILTRPPNIAGLWKHEIPRLLQWEVRGTGKRPRTYIAPSWSWASLTGSISFQGFTAVSLDVINVNFETLHSNDPFGQVTAGTLQVRGMISETRSTSA
ncbi:hypothetical protein B0H63DRAFT_288467 [Podospora didyma]|uniref:Uncharacterized protein n=1 Tax=Podospora didyma TaxID=330526 RepID=A0AAE0K8I8_9PEZI|nr:hypothetical protein B0H63DRAFT_93472 [Podospora didyma]KAK3372099.1 hypothetical protein B0H63DRAFT_288467 [Podospora didyma]